MSINSSPPQTPKRKRGRRPKKPPIDTQTMMTAPKTIASGLSIEPTFGSFQSTFNANLSPVAHTNPKSQKSFRAPQNSQQTQLKPAAATAPPPAPPATMFMNIPSSPPVAPHNPSMPFSSPLSGGLGIFMNPAGQQPGEWTIDASCFLTQTWQQRELDMSQAQMINGSPHVNPSLIFSSPMNSTFSSSSPRVCSSSSASSGGIAHSPNTPHTFSHIIHSSPMYHGYYSSPVVTREDDKEKSVDFSPQLTVKPLLPQTTVSSQPVPAQSEPQQNSINRKTILERRTSTNSIGLSSKLQLRRVKETAAPIAAANNFVPPRNGAMSAPVTANPYNRLDDTNHHPLKFRVSLSIDNNGQAVIQHREPLTSYSESAKTLFDRSVDYLNDSARRMSLESLFPELSPRQDFDDSPNVATYFMSNVSLPLELDSDVDTDYEEEDDQPRQTYDSLYQGLDDARLALRRALEQRTAFGSRSASVPEFGYYPASA